MTVERPGEDLPPEGDGVAVNSRDRDAAIRRAFVEQELGAHSSHPDVAPRRLAFWRWVAVSVGGLATSYAVYAVWRSFSWENGPLGGTLTALRTAIKSTNYILFAIAVGLSAALAAALTIRVSRLGSRSAQPATSPLVLTGVSLLLAAVLFGLCAGFGWMATTTSWKWIAAHRWWVAFAAALPLECILLYSEWKERRDDGTVLGWIFAALRQVWFMASVSATAMLMTDGASRTVGKFVFHGMESLAGSGLLNGVPVIGPIIGTVAKFGGTVLAKNIGGFITSALSLGAAMLVIAWVSSKVAKVASTERVSARAPAAGTGFWGRIKKVLSFLNPLSWFRRREPDAGAAEEEGAAGPGVPAGGPGWAKSIPAALKELVPGRVQVAFAPLESPAGMRASPDFAPESGEDHLGVLFSGRPPTVDQEAALRMFDERWFRHSRALQAVGFGRAPESHADLMVQAFPESYADPEDDGVLEFQVAASILAVVSRGQRVLFLVPDEAERERIAASVQARFEALRIETLYRVDGMAPGDLSRWAPPAAAPGTQMDERPPDVMVATLSDYEQAFFGGANAPHVMRAVLFDAEVVMVPNLVALSRAREGRLHFPFVLDKHRLLLASENRSMQLVLGTTPIGERPVADRASVEGDEPEVHVALEAIAMRFFGGDSSLVGHSAVLRRRAKSFPQRVAVRVPASSLAVALDAIAIHVAKSEGAANVCLVLGREDARLDDARRKALSVGKEPIEVVHELDCSDLLEVRERIAGYQFVVVQGRAGNRLVAEVGRMVDTETVTLVEVTASAAVKANPAPTWALTLPVFPSAESPALALGHLRSAVYQLSADTLIRRDELVRFGISWDRNRWSSGPGYETLHEGWSLELDGRLMARMDATEDQGEIWPAAILRRDLRKERPVNLLAPAERGLGLQGDEVLTLAQDGVPPDPDRTIVWVSQRGQLLGTGDLAYVSRFVWQGQRQEYRPVEVSHADGGWVVTAQPFHGDPAEPVLPVMRVTVSAPRAAAASALQVRQAEGVRLYVVRDGAKDRCVSRERIVALAGEDQAANAGADAGGGRAAFGPLEYSLRVGMSVLCMGSPRWIGELDLEAGAELPDWLSGDWEIGGATVAERRFSPALTAAVQKSLAAVAPGVLEFSRVAAFAVGGTDRGFAILFVEPRTTVGTAAEAMRTILDDRALRERFVGRMLEASQSDTDDSLPGAPLYDVDFDEGGYERDREWARTIVSAIPGKVVDVGGVMGVVKRDSDAAIDQSPEFIPRPIEATPAGDAARGGSDGKAAKGVHRWTWRAAKEEVRLSVELDIPRETADKATASFGCDPHEGDAKRLAATGIKLLEGNRITPAYSWMVARSLDDLAPIAQQLLAAAQAAGAETQRDRIEFFASFVQSFTYRLQAEGRASDGKVRLGVQMPAETLFTKAGDCDSLSVLLVALVRAAKLASGCVVIFDEVATGHAMAAFELEPRSKKDWSVKVRGRRDDAVVIRNFTVIETTASGSRLGQIDSRYHGRYARLDAVG